MAFNEKYVTASATGGGTGTQASPWTWDEAVANYAAGDRVNVKAGTYTSNGTNSTTNGSLTQPVVFRGYKDSIGDMDDVPLNGLVDGTDIPTVSTSTNASGPKGQYIYVNNISFTTNQSFMTYAWDFGLYGALRHCRFISTHAQGSCPVRGKTFFGCYAETASLYGAIAANAFVIDSCVFRGVNGGLSNPKGLSLAGVCTNSLFVNFSPAIDFRYPSIGLIANNTFVDCDTAINFSSNNPTNGARIISNNYFYSCTTALNDGFRTDDPTFHMINNGFYNVTTQASSGIAFNLNSKVDTSDPFEDYSNNDFRLKSSSVGYGASEQSVFDYYSISNNRDIGALQSQPPSGGGNVIVIEE